MHRILYRLIAALAPLAVRTGHSKDLEVIVLRHQLQVLRIAEARPGICGTRRLWRKPPWRFKDSRTGRCCGFTYTQERSGFVSHE